MKYSLLNLLFLATILFSCKPHSAIHLHNTPPELSQTPAPPDYKLEKHWAALPGKSDQADLLPHDTLSDRQTSSPADVFFIYPTLFSQEPQEANKWNADVNNEALNARIDEQSLRNQASVFNGAGRVFAPRYRQAHISAYYTKDSLTAKAAFDTAYTDVKQAFLYYLQHYNNGRPFILAGHSQGTNHAKRLLQELVDGKPLQEKLIAAYLVGMPIRKTDFSSISPCESPEETACFVSWRTWLKEHTPYPATLPANYEYPVSTNPLSWTTTDTYASNELNKGGVLRSFKLVPRVTDAQNHNGVLWINRPRFFGSFLFKLKNWHVADYNLFYVNIRENVWQRVQAFEQKKSGSKQP